jgi:DNA replication protein DnaC
MQEVIKNLKDFKLSGMVNTLEERLVYARSSKLSHIELLELLCEDERNNRQDNNYKRRYNASKLSSNKKLEDFNFGFQSSINEEEFRELCTGSFIKKKENVLFIGDSGVGKTHLAISLGLKALSKDHSVYFTSVSDMLYNLHMSKADNSYHKKLKNLVSYDLLILDELGFKSLPKYSSDDFFNVISKRYETGSIIITTNKVLDEWNDIFEEAVLTNAILDRLIHHSVIFNIRGKSYRSRQLKQIKEEVKMG